MRFDIVTIFREFFSGPLDYGIVRRARETKLIEVAVSDLREFAHDRHRTVDDRPFGGGAGMVLKPEPLFEAVESLVGSTITPPHTAIVLLSASGELFRQETAREFAELERLVLLCGRYEGVDERVAEHLATHEISIGDFVLAGGEIAAMAVIEAAVRLRPGVLGDQASTEEESFMGHLLEYPHFTRPQEFEGRSLPAVLTNGNHKEISKWRRAQAEALTRARRPDLWTLYEKDKG